MSAQVYTAIKAMLEKAALPCLRVGGPYPGVSLIYTTAAGTGWPDPSPDEVGVLAVLDQRTHGERDPQAVAQAEAMAAGLNALPGLIASLRAAEELLREWYFNHDKPGAVMARLDERTRAWLEGR